MLRSFVDTVDIWLSKQPDPVAALFYGAPIVEAANPPIPEGEIAKGVRGGKRLEQLVDIFKDYDGPEISGMA